MHKLTDKEQAVLFNMRASHKQPRKFEMKYRQRFENYIKRSYWFVGGYASKHEGDNMYFDVENKCYTNRDTQHSYEIFCAGIRSQQQRKRFK